MASKPRIYIVITNFLPQVGGAERQALSHARSLRDRGHDAAIVTLRHQTAWPRYESIEEIPVIRVAGGIVGNRERLPGPLRKLAYLLGVWAIGWVLWRHRRRYDVLCVYQLGLLVLPAVVVSLLATRPMVIGLRSAGSEAKESAPGTARGGAALPADDALRSSMRMQNREISDVEALDRLPGLVRRCTLYLFRRAGVVLVVLSARMQREVAEYDLRLPVLYIPNGVDLTRFSPISEHSGDERRLRTVVCIARLAYSKGIDILLRAWRLVQNEEPHARLIIVGRGPLREQLEGLATQLGVEKSVEFAGLQHDVPAQLHRGSVSVLPSRWEGMPNALLEAMACGLPCVATRVSGSEDLVQDRETGLLVNPEDAEAIACALLTLLRNPTLAQEYGRAARAAVERRYSNEHIVDCYVALYERLAVSS